MSEKHYDMTVWYGDGIQPEKDEEIRAIVAEHGAGFLGGGVLMCGRSAGRREQCYRLPDEASADTVAERLRGLGYAVVFLRATAEPMAPPREPIDPAQKPIPVNLPWDAARNVETVSVPLHSQTFTLNEARERVERLLLAAKVEGDPVEIINELRNCCAVLYPLSLPSGGPLPMLSLRDWFAAHAPISLQQPLDFIADEKARCAAFASQTEWCYQWADAMLTARKTETTK